MYNIKFYDDSDFVHSTTRKQLKAKVVKDVFTKYVLILAPHPDDGVFGCGGLMLHLAKKGANIKILYIFDGANGNRTGERDIDLIADREKEAFRAMKYIGVSEVNFLRLAEGNRGDKLYERILEELKTRPQELVLIPSKMEWHDDHKNVYEAFLRARKRVKKQMEVWQYHVWGIGEPNIIFPVDKYVKDKNCTIKMFKTQLRVKKFDDAIMAMDEYLGKGLGISNYAEGYTQDR